MPPPDLVRVARYERRVAASIERVWENVRDWEHLPSLHASSFRSIALEEESEAGWRARIGLHGGAEIALELAIEANAPRYVSRTIEGPGAGSEIWTTVTEFAPHATDVAVEFHLPGVAPAQRDAIGAAYVQLYTRLWDEDESMMVRRARELARPRGGAASHELLALGTLEAVRARIPFCFDWAGARWRLVEIDGAIHVHATTCPHWLGPLDDAPIENGAVTCPWHGWRFDLATARALDGRRARLPTPPPITIAANGTVLVG
jgi:nitrite reductase/ring-hydroxylating ferredoxin subunit/uncharacterized protein YndB with AHSA1/START domain